MRRTHAGASVHAGSDENRTSSPDVPPVLPPRNIAAVLRYLCPAQDCTLRRGDGTPPYAWSRDFRAGQAFPRPPSFPFAAQDRLSKPAACKPAPLPSVGRASGPKICAPHGQLTSAPPRRAAAPPNAHTPCGPRGGCARSSASRTTSTRPRRPSGIRDSPAPRPVRRRPATGRSSPP